MIRRGEQLHQLYGPSAAIFADDMLTLAATDKGPDSYSGQLFGILCFPRWFDRHVFDAALSALGIPIGAYEYETFLEQEFIKEYSKGSFYISDSVRYALIERAYRSNERLGEEHLRSFFGLLNEVAISVGDRVGELTQHSERSSSIYFIEALYLEMYFTTSVQKSLNGAFLNFLNWRREPYFHTDLNRRLVKALSDHAKTGLFTKEFENDFLYMLRSTIPPWDVVSQKRVSSLKQLLDSGRLDPLPLAYCCREYAISLAFFESHEAEGFFQRAAEIFRDQEQYYWVGDTKRYYGKYLLETGRIDDAQKILGQAQEIFESIDNDAQPTKLLSSECRRLFAWGEYHRGGKFQSNAFEIAREEIGKLLSDGELYQAALFLMLLAREAWLKHNFAKALQHLNDAESVLFVSGESIDLANCYVYRAATRILWSEAHGKKNWDHEKTLAEKDLIYARKIFEMRGSQKSISQIYYWKSVSLYLSQEFDEAIKHVDCAASGFKKRNDIGGWADAMFRRAVYQAYRGESYKEVLRAFRDAKSMAEKADGLKPFAERVQFQASIENELQNIMVSVARELGLEIGSATKL